MTISELIKKLKPYDNDAVAIIGIGEGWANIEKVKTDGVNVIIDIEKEPLFSD